MRPIYRNGFVAGSAEGGELRPVHVFYYAFAGFGPRESGEAGQLVGLLKVGMKLRCLPKEYEKQQLEKQNKGN
jgi:hypothetical protein